MSELLAMLDQESLLIGLGLDCGRKLVLSPDEIQEAFQTFDDLDRKYKSIDGTEKKVPSPY